MKMRLLLAYLLLLGLSPVLAQSAPQIHLHDLKDAGALGSELYANSGATGMVLVVVRGDQVFIRGYGETAPGSHIAPSENSVIRLCSLTKIFTSDLLAKMVADGTVHLDDPLQKYAPAGVRVPEQERPITLLELATHTAGLDREIGTPPRHTPHFAYPDFATRWQWLPTERLKFVPGTQAFYSNIGFDLLSDALASAAHTPYSTLLWSRTLRPLGMWETTFYPTAAQCARLLQGAHNEGPCTVTENSEGSSGLYSTPEDMAKWLRYLVGSGTAALPAQPPAAKAVYLQLSSLTSTYGLSHAGRPSGIGLGWMHLDAGDEAFTSFRRPVAELASARTSQFTPPATQRSLSQSLTVLRSGPFLDSNFSAPQLMVCSHWPVCRPCPVFTRGGFRRFMWPGRLHLRPVDIEGIPIGHTAR
ncbi:MAG TPA: D-alanyl-D-alanine-carboxypeptidase/endopeptidase AmpH [Terracidiphilus sp.]|nr:D-alanyl-D-alanine-carboxypeptidase/endopeptidase AmpH [Terracidiphilus sp.]